MAEQEKPAGGEDGGQAAPQKKKLGMPMLALLIGLPVLLLGGGGAAAYVLFFAKGAAPAEAAAKAEEAKAPKPMVFYNLPELLVNLNSQGRRSSFLKISVSLELSDPADIPRIESVLPRIVDAFQTYLRELRPEDLRGSAGLYRLREELLARVNTSAQPARVTDVLFKEMLIQ
jgi:flagellar FliL protein